MKTSVYVNGNVLTVNGEDFYVDDFDTRCQLNELLFRGGMHVTDEAGEAKVLVDERNEAVKGYSPFDRMYVLALAGDGEARMNYEPSEREDFLANLTVLEDDTDADVFLKDVKTLAYGSVAERAKLISRLDAEMGYPELARKALVAVHREGIDGGRQLLAALSKNSKHLIYEMQKVVGQA